MLVAGRAFFVGPGCLVCPWAAARPLTVRAASFARRVVSKPGQAPPPPTGTAARPLLGPRPSPPALAPDPHAPIPAPTRNFARNSPATASSFKLRSLELQRFQTSLKLQPIELRATFRGQTPNTTTDTAAWPTPPPSPRTPSPYWDPAPRPQPSRPALTLLSPEPTRNFACNSPNTISNLEFRSMELQRFQTSLKLQPIELRATFLERRH